jgi:hypothetical protein
MEKKRTLSKSPGFVTDLPGLTESFLDAEDRASH